MFSRNVTRFSQRASQQARAVAQRRFNSSEAKPSWIVDNEFNRERAAVKHHAASTSGTCARNCCYHLPFLTWPAVMKT